MWRWISVLAVAGVALGCYQPADPPSNRSVTILVEDPDADLVSITDMSALDSDFQEIPITEAMSRMPQAVSDVIDAINREDWEALNKFNQPDSRSGKFLTKNKQDGVRIHKLSSVKYGVEFEDRSCTAYHFSMQERNGDPHPHFFEMLVYEDDMQAEVLDFWEYGW